MHEMKKEHLKDFINKLLLLGWIKIQLSHLQSVRLTLLLAETEDDDRSKVSLHDHLDNLEAVAALLHAALPALLVTFGGVPCVLQHRHRCGKVLFSEGSVLIHHQVDSISASREHVMLQ